MNKSGHKERVEYWRRVLGEQRQSGLTVKAFCQSRKIAMPSFYQWRRKLQAVDGKQGAARFLPVTLVDNQSPVGPIAPSHATGDARRGVQIVTPGGFYLRVDSTTSIDDLAALLRAIEACESPVAVGGHRALWGQQTAGSQHGSLGQSMNLGQRGEAC